MACLFKKPSGVYCLALFVDGKRVYKSTHAHTKPEALRFLTQYRERASKSKDVALSAFQRDFLDFSEKNHASKTYLCNRRVLDLFTSFVGDKHLHLIRPFDVERFKNHRLEQFRKLKDGTDKHLTPTTVNIELRGIKSALGYAVKWGVLEKNPAAGVRQVRIPEAAPVFLSREQARAVLTLIADPGLRDVVTFALHTGLRLGEILNLRWQDVDLQGRTIRVVNTPTFKTKNGRMRTIPSNEVVHHVLNQRARVSEYVFTTEKGRQYRGDFVSRQFKRAARKAGLPEGVHFHSPRHTHASWLVTSGVSIYDVKTLLGHSSIGVTQIYAHNSAPEYLRQSVERIVVSSN